MKLSTFLLFDRGPRGDLDVLDRGLELCVAADELGFDTVWVAEHHFGTNGGLPNPAVFLAAAAMRTRRVRLGPAVAVLPFRHPSIVAEDYALVDRLSNGRLVMGVGAGAVEGEFAGFDLDPATRHRCFVERLEVLRALWCERADPGRVAINVRPSQRPHPPIWVATNRPAGAYHAGREGLGLLTLVSPSLESLDAIGPRLAEHRRGTIDGGHQPAPNAVALIASVGETAEEARLAALGPLASFAATHGLPPEDGESLYDRLLRRGTAALGSAADAARTIRRLAQMGAEEAVLWCCFADMPSRTAIRSMRHAAERVRPLLDDQAI